MSFTIEGNGAPILVFDSGVGGLSVVAHLKALLPDTPLAYACDNAALPYGTKPDEWLIKRIVDVCQQAVRQSGAKALVVACNTASTLALKELRAALDIPVVGTVPAIKPAAAASHSKVIGLLATSATLKRAYTDNLIERFASEARVIKVSGDRLVLQAERWLAGHAPDPAEIQSVIAPFFDDPELDTVVLGCTHFPLLRAYFERLAPRKIQWVDSGAAIAQRTAAVTLGGSPLAAAITSSTSSHPLHTIVSPATAVKMATHAEGEVLLDENGAEDLGLTWGKTSGNLAEAGGGSQVRSLKKECLKGGTCEEAMPESDITPEAEITAYVATWAGHSLPEFLSLATAPDRAGLASALERYRFARPRIIKCNVAW